MSQHTPKPAMTIGRRIREVTARRGRHLNEVADFAGIGRTTMSRLVNDHSDPRVSTLASVADELGVSVAALVDTEFDATGDVELTIQLDRRTVHGLRNMAESTARRGASTVAGVVSQIVSDFVDVDSVDHPTPPPLTRIPVAAVLRCMVAVAREASAGAEAIADDAAQEYSGSGLPHDVLLAYLDPCLDAIGTLRGVLAETSAEAVQSVGGPR